MALCKNVQRPPGGGRPIVRYFGDALEALARLKKKKRPSTNRRRRNGYRKKFKAVFVFPKSLDKAEFSQEFASRIVRPLAYRDGKKSFIGKKTGGKKGGGVHKGLVRAHLWQERGVEEEKKCTACEKGKGPFTTCIVLPGKKRSCVNCYIDGNGSGAPCSYYKEKK